MKIRTLIEGLLNGPRQTDHPLLLSEMAEALDVAKLRQVGTRINQIVDFDESLLEGRVVVKPDVDEDLDEMKRICAGLDSLLVSFQFEIIAMSLEVHSW